MDKIKKRFTLLNAVVEAMIKQPETIKYPFAAMELPEGFRGAIVFDPDKCSGCGLCVRDCPAEALHINKKSREEYTLLHYPARCAYCGQCEDSCRHGAISHSNKLVGATTHKDDWVLVFKDSKASQE
ncbi:MAG TPA: 4Fe-4S ferredoxin [Anaerolineaceae bacterium]|jgi:formate hydrogenlyase subunit 6/NADH:ubiquinone oxidoreductase subunit I|nr:MAG: 4Fe-4S ferredoxin [Marinimicrobia bacterium 46_43]HAF49063.1 4Fe-4S ferredoxin [Anaerolineaceae bacterium]